MTYNYTCQGTALIHGERRRQQTEEKWTEAHDDAHTNRELLRAAICYANDAQFHTGGIVPTHWPWNPKWWKPSPDPVKNLVKAGALIAAEIDRIQRQRLKTGPACDSLRAAPPGGILSVSDIQDSAKLMAESFMTIALQMHNAMASVTTEDIKRAQKNGDKKKSRKKPAAKKPGKGSRAKRQAAFRRNRGKRNR